MGKLLFGLLIAAFFMYLPFYMLNVLLGPTLNAEAIGQQLAAGR